MKFMFNIIYLDFVYYGNMIEPYLNINFEPFETHFWYVKWIILFATY